MGRFLQALVSEGRARTGGGLFRGVVDSAFAPAVTVPGLPNETRYGFGVFVDCSPWGERVWHPGSVRGFSAYWAAVPASRLAVAVLTNRDGVRLEPIADAAFLVAMGARPSAARSGAKGARAPRAGGSQARRRDGASMASAAAGSTSDESPVPRAQAPCGWWCVRRWVPGCQRQVRRQGRRWHYPAPRRCRSPTPSPRQRQWRVWSRANGIG